MHRKSPMWLKLKKDFKRKKRHAIKTFHTDFVTDLKASDPGKFYMMCKKIGAVDEVNAGALKIKSLEGLNDKQCAEAVAQHFAAISNEYEPVDLTALPAYLPALPPPQYEEYEVYQKMLKMKKRPPTRRPLLTAETRRRRPKN